MKKTIAIHLTCAGLLFTSSFAVQADDGEFFDSGFLFRPDNQELPTDLSIFSHTNRVLPGPQQVKIVVNERNFGDHTVNFIDAGNGAKDAVPCLTIPLLQTVGIKTIAFPEISAEDENACVDLSLIPAATFSFDSNSSILTLSIPQAALDASARGAVPMSMWDDGETSFWASYQLSHYRASNKYGGEESENSNSTFLGLRAGFNAGAWRIRSNGTLYRQDGDQHWNTNETYAERDINAWRSRIRLGDVTTNNRNSAFTTNRIRGVQLASEDGMLAPSEQGYAPTVQGYANSSAKVTVYQNGNVIYSTFVAPGPFMFNDLYAIPGGGDLEVEIEENGGKITRYIQPYSVLPSMLREGRWQYSASVGKYRAYDSDSDEPLVAQATFAHGLPGGVTVYGGSMVSKNYFANSLGVALNMSDFGGISTDIVHSNAKDQEGKRLSGHAIRVQYAKNLQQTGTDFRLFAYRYSSDGYRDLDQVLRKTRIYTDPINGQVYDTTLWNKSHEYQVSISQSLGEYGSVSASYSKIQYHSNVKASNSFNIGYNTQIGPVNVFLNYNMLDSEWQRRSHNFMLNLSIPLGSGSTYAGYSFSRQNDGNYSHDATLSGSTLENNALSYSLRTGVSRDDRGRGNNIYASTSYKNSIGQVAASYSRSHKNTQTQLSVSGSLVIDKGGLLLGQYLTETAIIVDAPGAANVRLQSHPSISTNSSGRALIPYAAAYRENMVSLAPDYYDDNVTLRQNIQSVVPTQGAIVVVTFETEQGRSYLFTLKNDGRNVPFGAAVYDAEGLQRSIVGPIGRLWMTGLLEPQIFTVKWGTNGSAKSCEFSVDPEVLPASTDTVEKEMTCE
ncbi:fimbria/pilus outer membrane usher protein [Paenalcaligenes sp. Me52]|uniref:fimbria/pilus outer membrane usher protein n=1 Tax=Paenalcaligenes sp. Me52 TaxID=3392038 RepID=UPI003D2C6688